MPSSRVHIPLLAPPDLLHALRNTPPSGEYEAILEEFALRSLVRGVRVRQWCAELKAVLDLVSPFSTPLSPPGTSNEQVSPSHSYLTALQTPSLMSLHPFIVQPSPAEPPQLVSPTALLPLQTLPTVSVKQIIEALATLSRSRHLAKAEHLTASVMELCLEFIGRGWRQAIELGTEQEVVEGLTKSFIEIEFELQCVGDASTLRSTILPILRNFRFSLGFISSHRLASRLSTLPDTVEGDGTTRTLVQAWLTRRLNVGMDRAALQEQIGLLLLKLRSHRLKTLVGAICAEYHIQPPDEPVPVEAEKPRMDPAVNEFGLLSPPVSIASLAEPPLFASSKRGWISWGKPTLTIPTPDTQRNTLSKAKWFGHKRHHTSMSKLMPPLLPPAFNPDRRPSLPILHPLTSPSSVSVAASPPAGSSNSVANSEGSALPLSPRTPHLSRASCLTTAMAASALQEVFGALTDHLLDMRFRIHQPDGTWHLGEGRVIAVEVVNSLEQRLRAKYHAFEIEDRFYDLRTSFVLVSPSVDLNASWSSYSRGGETPRQRELSDPVYLPIHREEQVISPTSATSRGTSFDLDQYLRDIGGTNSPEGDADESDAELLDDDQPTPLLSATHPKRRISFGASSILSALSRRTSNGRTEKASARGSALSQYAYSIREAKRELPYHAVAVQKGLTVDTARPSRDLDRVEHSGTMRVRRSSWKQNFASMSTPNLATDKYTTMPLRLRSSRSRPALDTLQPRLGSRVILAEEEEDHDRAPAPLPHTLSAPELAKDVPDDVLSLLAALDSTTPSKSTPSTPVPRESPVEGRERRQRNRRWAIVDQIEISPSTATFPNKPSIESVLTPSDRPRPVKVSSASSDDVLYVTAPSTPAGNLSQRFGLGLGLDTGNSTLPENTSGTPPSSSPSKPSTSPGSPARVTTSPKELPVPLEALIPILKQSSMGIMFGVSESRVSSSLERFVDMEKSRTEQLGMMWDGEGKARAVWVLEQVGQMIEDPGLKYTVHSAIRRLRRSLPPTAATELTRDRSSETLATSPPHGMASPLYASRSFDSNRSVDTLGTFGHP